MDGLLPSPPGESGPLKIPYLDLYRYEYVPGGLRNHAGVCRQGQGGAAIDVEQILSHPGEEAASFLQAWLFFGLMSEYFGLQVSLLHCLQLDPDFATVVVIDKKHTINLVGAWRHNLSRMSQSEQQERRAFSNELLQFALEQSERFDHAPDRIRVDTLAVIALSVKLLISALRSLTDFYLGDAVGGVLNMSALYIPMLGRLISQAVGTSETDNKSALLPLPPGGKEPLSTKVLINRFRDNGWCPCRARQLCQLYDYSVVNYICRIPLQVSQREEHNRCKGKCRAYDLSPEQIQQYSPKHTPSCNGCSNFKISTECLVRKIQRGRIPILSMDPMSPDLSILLTEHDGRGSYIAISHVWSDGLGNPLENALPMCQLKRLGSVLSTLRDQKFHEVGPAERWFGACSSLPGKSKRRVYFWMDTLCIPRQSAAENPRIGDERELGYARALKDARTQAIKYITPIFSGAGQVLILDSELERLTNADWQDEEHVAALILGSKWVQRAWTLEEGSLARRCQFKLQGTTVKALSDVPKSPVVRVRSSSAYCGNSNEGSRWHSSNLNSFRQVTRSLYFQQPLKTSLLNILNNDRKQAYQLGMGRKQLKWLEERRLLRFVDAWNSLLERSATESDDPFIIFANILDFNIASIISLRVHERLPTIVTSCRELPLSLLYNTENEIVQNSHPSDAWIPSKISGDRLTKDYVMTKWKDSSRDKFGFQIQLGVNGSSSLEILVTSSLIPFGEILFCIRNAQTDEQYVIEIHSSRLQDGVLPSYKQTSQDSYNDGISTCILIDKKTGSNSRNSYTGRGARLSRLNNGETGDIFVRFDSAIVAWSYDQWRERAKALALPSQTFTTSRLSLVNNQHIVLEYSKRILYFI
jgi:hypothetical protein